MYHNMVVLQILVQVVSLTFTRRCISEEHFEGVDVRIPFCFYFRGTRIKLLIYT
jgi:hypothetical protein